MMLFYILQKHSFNNNCKDLLYHFRTLYQVALVSLPRRMFVRVVITDCRKLKDIKLGWLRVA